MKKEIKEEVQIKLLPCPFCGIIPVLGGIMYERKNGEIVPQVCHQITNNCPLDMLIFWLSEWQKRINNK